MSKEQTIGQILEGISAQVLAADIADKKSIAAIGVKIESATGDSDSLPEKVKQCFSILLNALHAVYCDTVDDAQIVMDAIASTLCAAAELIQDDGDDSALGDDLHQTCTDLNKLLYPAAQVQTASGEPVTPKNAEPASAVEEVAEPEPAAEPLTEPVASKTTPPKEHEFPPEADILPADSDMELLGEFIVECVDHISAAEASLLDLESDPSDIELINTIFRAFHTIKGTSGFLGLERVQRLAHLAENMLDRARDEEIVMKGGYADLALESCDALRTMIESLDGIDAGDPLVIPDTYAILLGHLSDPEAAGFSDEEHVEQMRLGDILVAQGRVARETVDKAARLQKNEKIGKVLIDNGEVKASDVAKALRTQKKLTGEKPKSKTKVEATVRVGTGRLDNLINMVGELVISHSMVTQDPIVANGSDPRLARNVSHSGKIIRELQDLTMSLRMVPLKGMFQKMARLVRDLARKAGKQVEFITEGDETEIDRSMVEVLADPLVHMMRNSVDHGVESAEDRQAAGKTPVGTVRLRAFHAAGNVVIQIEDDGKGLDREKILAKAVSKGLVEPGRDLPDSEAFGLIFQPGFSTAAQVTDISGRGVGMDVVKRGIESLRGRVDVSSEQGVGSTFSIRVPLTLAIADAMLLKVGQQRFLLPTVSIEQSFRPEPKAVSSVVGRGEMVMVRGSLLPVYRLHEMFSISDAVTSTVDGLLIIIESEGQRCALMVDDLLSQQQVVIKCLGDSLGNIPGISGGAILGDGQVGLILDASGLLKMASGKDEPVAA